MRLNMCFKKNNKPVRLEKKSSSNLDDLRLVLTIPEIWVIVGFVVIFILVILLAFLNRNSFWYNVPL